MAIPPFPSQDLAKLVLGYLVEEQLMTAYDEFLQASPYLDAYRNEYDRILMTSLKHILAEYRAVKIYVETCKPITLRKKLLQCSNLVDVMTYLVGNIDVKKLQCQDVPSDKPSLRSSNERTSSKPGCEVCNSSRLGSCMCRSKQSTQISHSIQDSTSTQFSHLESTTVECSVEATLLADLPGHQTTRSNHHVRAAERNPSFESVTNSDSETNYESNLIKLSHIASQLSAETNLSNCVYSTSINNLQSNPSQCANSEKSEAELNKMEEFDNVLNSVIAGNNNDVAKRMSNAGTFQDFASGVQGTSKITPNVPDSSTSENLPVLPCSKPNPIKKTKCSKKALKGPQLLMTINYPEKNLNIDDENSNSENSHIQSASENKKPEEQKVTILSDVRVEKPGNQGKPPVLANATSTPLLQMQTILINGTPAYKHRPLPYTKDEIMAMPTIILVPTSAPPNLPSCAVKSTATHCTNTTTTFSTSTNMCPITIDISSDSPIHDTSIMDDSRSKSVSTTVKPKSISSDLSTLVKTVDLNKNASVPKDNVMLSNNKSSTPNVLPLLRKSSSTPRRNSHVRVLDFTTPRRILHETINEIANDNVDGPLEIVINSSPNLNLPETGTVDKDVAIEKKSTTIGDMSKSNISTKENVKRKNWDADLRALACAGSPLSPKSRPKPKARSVKKKKDIEAHADAGDKSLKVSKKSTTPTEKKTKKMLSRTKTSAKKKPKIQDIVEPDRILPSAAIVHIKPTINIISNPEFGPSSNHENEKSQNLPESESKSDDKDKSYSDDRIDTPEMERLSLQNVIGAKLNISDILETPYKQALYDIQMETPRFLGPDLPNDPMSDIKIMNIPTPRFFDTPNLALTPKASQATPSSFSSRPTDYSSGSSYYKPDDYMPIPDLRPMSSISKDKQVTEKVIIEIPLTEEANKKEKPPRRRSTRPIRQCTKNVSYRNSPGVKSRNENKVDAGSSCSETLSINSSFDTDQPEISRKAQTKPRVDGNKINFSKKKITPVKKGISKANSKTKTKTPLVISKYKKSPLKLPSKNKGKQKVIYTEKNIHSTLAVVPLPTKSRRKSSTPRKLHCTKTFNSENSGDTVQINKSSTNDPNIPTPQDSDTEHPALRWSDDGSQECKQKETICQVNSPINEDEDILKIQKFIETTKPTIIETENRLHNDLVQKGFDTDTAKNIERDLENISQSSIEYGNKSSESQTKQGMSERTLESDCSAVLQIVQDENDDEIEEIEFSIHECNEDTKNYIKYEFDDAKEHTLGKIASLKDKFCMEVCIEDGVDVMLHATSYVDCFDMDPVQSECIGYSFSETEAAVNSISNYDSLYTPLKNAAKSQFYDIFDSTLTSLDTPLKVNSPSQKESETTVTEIVLEVEQIVEQPQVKKRKRESVCSDDSLTENKKSRPETQYLLNSASIQDIDIESVLSKLHGP